LLTIHPGKKKGGKVQDLIFERTGLRVTLQTGGPCLVTRTLCTKLPNFEERSKKARSGEF